MARTLAKNIAIKTFPAHQPEIPLGIHPGELSDNCLELLRRFAEQTDEVGDDLRGWLLESVLRESGRRVANADAESRVQVECSGWSFRWHDFDDDQLAQSLSTSYTWLHFAMDHEEAAIVGSVHLAEACDVLLSIHRAVVAACIARLRELHQAIERAGRVEG